MKRPAIVLLAPRQRDLARRIAGVLEGARIHAPAEIAAADECPYGVLSGRLRELFRDGVPIIGLFSAAIAVRILGPVLADKRSEPPVLVVDPSARFVVPLLGGHRGANRLAAVLAEALDAVAVVTTASDTAFGLALDDPPPGWRLEGAREVKDLLSRLLAGETVRLVDDCGCGDWLKQGGLPFAEPADNEIRVTWRNLAASPRRLVYHPPVLALGVGSERNASPQALEECVREAMSGIGASSAAVACVCSLDIKAAEPAIQALARRLGVPARFFSRAELAAQHSRLLSPSREVEQAVGVAGVAEAAALAAAGEGARLLVPKRRGRGVTCAVALAPGPLEPERIGRARGELHLVGLGPGDAAFRTREAEQALERAEDLVGYRLYLDLLGDLREEKSCHPFELGEERQRCRHALELAARGRRVALVCSGDPGIYALASPLLELLDAEGAGHPEWQRIALHIHPGISAMQLASARAGAPLGHDFCAISLSDLLTPRERIEARLRAAAAADFVVALYNPASRRRVDLLRRAREILLEARPPDTPVVVGRALGRRGETLRCTTLAAFEPDEVDMLSVVLIGSSKSRTAPRLHGRPWVYTPRGYAGK